MKSRRLAIPRCKVDWLAGNRQADGAKNLLPRPSVIDCGDIGDSTGAALAEVITLTEEHM